MADYFVAVRNGGFQAVHSPDAAVIGSILKSESSNDLVLTPGGTNVSVAANKSLTMVSGSGSVDFSAASGTFAAPAGVSTFAGALYANGGLDRSAAATLQIGVTNANAVTISKSGVTTTVAGSLIVAQNLTVQGATTTIDSTVVDIADRVIHVNHSTGANDPVPSAITGIGVHRGAVAGVDRDHAALLWDETNSRWNFALNTGGDDSTIGADQAVKLGALTVTGNFSQTGAVTFSTGTGTFTHNGAVVLAGVAVTASGAASMDLSGGSGIFKTSTGAVTIGPGAISISGDATIATGVTLSTTGTGMINLPSLFQINSVAVSANVTAANLDELTGGGATTLHSHAASSSAVTDVPETAGEALDAGALLVYQNDAGTAKMFHADADASGRKDVLGYSVASAADDAAVSVRVAGKVDVPDAQWTGGVPAVADAGKPVYMSETAGKSTLVEPSATGARAQRVGFVARGGTGAVRVLISIGEKFDI